MGTGDVPIGRVKYHEEPTRHESTEAWQRFIRDSLDRKKMLLMAVANGGLAYDSPAVSTFLAHRPVYPEASIDTLLFTR